MLFPDIKAYLIEAESSLEYSEPEEDNDDLESDYIKQLENCKTIKELIQTVSNEQDLDYYEAAVYILEKVSK